MLALYIFLISFSMNNSTHIKERHFEGYIFPKEQPFFHPAEDRSTRFTPSKEDILKTERIIADNLKELNIKQGLINQVRGCPIIHKRLRRYVRQYFGLVNEDNEYIVVVGFFWDRSSRDLDLSNGIVEVFGGCSRYWEVRVNLNQEKLFNLSVNGVS